MLVPHDRLRTNQRRHACAPKRLLDGGAEARCTPVARVHERLESNGNRTSVIQDWPAGYRRRMPFDELGGASETGQRRVHFPASLPARP